MTIVAPYCMRASAISLDNNKMTCHSILDMKNNSSSQRLHWPAAAAFTATRNGARPLPRRSAIAALFFLCFLFGLPASSAQAAEEQDQRQPTPTVIVQIKFKAGAGEQWVEAFEQQIAPAIQEAIDQKDEITSYSYFENVVSGQAYDFALIMQTKSFAFLDRRREYPHYRALFRRLGPEKAEKLLADMSSWEAEVHVTLVRGYGSVK